MSWPFDWTVYLGLALFGAGYAVLARGLGCRPRHAAWFSLGTLTIWVALETPIDTLADGYLQSVHMVQHVLLLVVAPPLLLLGLSPSMARAVAAWPGVRRATDPWPALAASSVILVGWHIPALYDLTLQSESIHIVEHLTFIAAGLLFWWPVLRATSAAARRQLGDGWKLVYLFAGTIPQDAVALPLIFSRALFYPFYGTAPRLAGWLTPVVDQDVAGVVMMVLAKVSVLIAMLVIFFRWVAREQGPDPDAASLQVAQRVG